MTVSFVDKREFRQVMDGLFGLMARDPDTGPALRAANTPQRFVFTDLDLVVSIRAAEAAKAEKGVHLEWAWTDEWPVLVTLKMSSVVANRFFQGRQNIPIAVAKGDIKVDAGDIARSLQLIPLVKPIFPKYVEWLRKDGRSHLVVD